MSVTREHVLRYRWRAQQLDRAPGEVDVADLAVLDLGIQSCGRDSVASSLVDRGVSLTEAVAATDGTDDSLALVWAVRGAPHFHRRSDLADLATALSPFDAADAYKRLAGTGGTWKKAGVDPIRALAALGAQMRAALDEPRVKGALSSALHGQIPAEYEVDCRPCGSTHPAEMAFRVAALNAGIELVPGTSPPVLRRIPTWPTDREIGPAPDPSAVPPRLDQVRAYLRLIGPATPADVAAYLDTSATVVKRVWPDDAVEVDRDGTSAWILEGDRDALTAATESGEKSVRLLSPCDLFTAARDRTVLLDRAHHKAVWPAIGRPGVVARDGEILGIWRPSKKGKCLTVSVDAWAPLDDWTRQQIGDRADILAASRGCSSAHVEGV